MYRCPKCNSELPADARFCTICGFNQTNARMQATLPPAKGVSGPENVQKQAASPVAPTNTPPPTPSTTPPPQVRIMQPDVKRIIPPRTQINNPAYPQKPPIVEQTQETKPDMAQPVEKKPPLANTENDRSVPPDSIRPVRTNTPPRSGMGSASERVNAIPVTSEQQPPAQSGVQLPEKSASAPTAQIAAKTTSIPAHLAALADQPTKRSISTPSSVKKADSFSEIEQQAFPEVREPFTPLPETFQQKSVEADEVQARSLSLKQRYLAEQATTHHAAHPSLASDQNQLGTQMAGQIVEKGRSVASGQAKQQPEALEPPMIDQPTLTLPAEPAQRGIPELRPPSESLAATSKAAEHWRKSWRDRQRAEAGPAVGISRGQAEVPEPLMTMQNSIARMRAVVMPQNSNKQISRGMNFGFWVTIVLLVCIAGGLGTYVVWSYLPSTQLASQISAAGNALPSMTVKGNNTTSVSAGHELQLHGDHFAPGNAILFILDNTPIHDATGKQLSVRSSSKGTFDTALLVPATWLAGSYALQAQDNQTGQHAFVNIQVLPGTASLSNDTALNLTLKGQPIATKGLAFKTIKGRDNSEIQQISLKNTGDTTLQWSATTVADNNLNWLVVTAGKMSGNLVAGDIDGIGIGVIATGLQSSAKAYTGRVIFTVNQKQAIIPVSLLVQDNAVEVVVNPDPVIAYLQTGGTCLPATLTLINLSKQVVTWNANPFDADKAHLNLDNQTTEQGTLDPSGLPNDTKVLKISCIGAQVGEKLYHISVYYNGIPVDIPVSIRNQ